MAYDIANIRAALKTLIQTVTKVSFVYDYSNPIIEGYPAVIFDMTNEDSSMLDDNNNLRTLTFTIWLAQETKVQGQVAAKGLLDAAAKDLINALELRSNDSLSSNVDWIMPSVGQRTQAESPQGLIMYQELILRANISSSIS